MAHIETRLNLASESGETGASLAVDLFTRARLLELVNRLAEPQLGIEMRLGLVKQMRGVLNGKMLEPAVELSG